jgi:serine phosphatase RsbU (regulator of sigma subunit)
MSIEAGDVLVACTDGITDGAGDKGHGLHEDGVAGIIWGNPSAGAAKMSKQVIEAAARFRASLPAIDDETVVVVRVLNAASEEPFCRHADELAMTAA